jgi:hypothetical protein
MRPSLTHACAVWMPLSETCKQALESWQYRAAKIVIKTRMNIPKAALLLEQPNSKVIHHNLCDWNHYVHQVDG